MTFEEAVVILVALREQTARPGGDEHLAFLSFCLANVSRSSSQFLQDLWVAYELKGRKNGYFVEFGAADGLRFSNTRMLETEFGWNGVLAEPARIWSPAIRQNRACFVDDRCVWSESGRTLTFNEAPVPEHSTIDSYSAGDLHAASRADGRRYEVETVSLNDLLAFWRAPRRIDYLSVDTEGSELDILGAFDFAAHDVRLISVEHNHTPSREVIFDLLSSKGYRRKFEKLSNVDDWYVRTY